MKKLVAFLLVLVTLAPASFANPPIRGGAAQPYTAPVPFQIGSRFAQPGQNGTTAGGSGDAQGCTTCTGQNSILSSYNESGATVNTVRVVWPNWYANSSNEVANSNSISVHTYIEYPAGQCQEITCGHLGICKVLSGANAISDVVTLSHPIPSGAQFWLHTFVQVQSGQTWPIGYSSLSSLGEKAHKSAGETDLSNCGSFTDDGNSFFAPIGVAGTSFTGTKVPVSLAGLGDSIIMGAGDGNHDGHGNTGWLGRAATSKVPYVNIGLTGQQAATNQPSQYTRRKDAMQKLGITHVMVDWAVNDIRLGAFTAAQTETNLQAIWADLAGSFKVIQSTTTVQSSSTDNWTTLANQTPFTPFSGSSSAHGVLVTYLKTVPSPLEQVWDVDSVLENDPVNFDGKWPVNGSWTDTSYTHDGLHPNVTNTGTLQGGVYPAATYGGTQITNLVNAGG